LLASEKEIDWGIIVADLFINKNYLKKALN
jgi:hypothetical protein